MIVSQDFETPVHPDALPMIGRRFEPDRIRAFYDDEWTPGARNVVLHLSGGATNNPRGVDNAMVVAATNASLIMLDVMRTPGNLVTRRHNIYPNTDQYSGSLDVREYIKTAFTTIASDPGLSGLITADSKIVLSGHSYGAGTLCHYSALWGRGGGQVESAFDNRVAGIIVNSPQNSYLSNGGYPEGGRNMRSAYLLPANVNTPLTYCVPVGDSTHLRRELFAAVYNTDVRYNPLLDIRYIGDDTYSHAWLGRDPGSAVWADMCLEAIANNRGLVA
ncbi:hypothetical protein [Vreelandella alkaliphila]|uniref:hypothetical protein n=1 Tax=Vreelandella alkaliphila TaxID=272774 RepID=UPI003FD75AF1